MTFVGAKSVLAHVEVCIDVGAIENRYLVDPASSHMFASRIKPCMSKYMVIDD